MQSKIEQVDQGLRKYIKCKYTYIDQKIYDIKIFLKYYFPFRRRAKTIKYFEYQVFEGSISGISTPRAFLKRFYYDTYKTMFISFLRVFPFSCPAHLLRCSFWTSFQKNDKLKNVMVNKIINIKDYQNFDTYGCANYTVHYLSLEWTRMKTRVNNY